MDGSLKYNESGPNNAVSSYVTPSQSIQFLNTNVSETFFDYSADLSLQDIADDFREDLLGYKEPMTIFLIVLYIIVFLMGLLGNFFVIVTVLRYKHMRTLTNVFLVNLSIGDLLVVLLCIPITSGNYIYKDFVYGDALCKLSPFFQGSAIASSSLTLLTISVNRFIAIHRPLRARIIFSKTKVVIIITLIWVLSFTVFLPLLVVNHVHVIGVPNVFERRICSENWNNPNGKQIYNVAVFIAIFVVPLIAMVFAYTKISFVLWKKHKEIQQTHRILLQRRRTVKMLICVVILFCVCWLPYNVVNIWLDFNLGSPYSITISDSVYPLVQILGISNSAINPLCYCLLRSGFQKTLFRLCCKNNRERKPDVILMVKFREGSSDDQEHTMCGSRILRSTSHFVPNSNHTSV